MGSDGVVKCEACKILTREWRNVAVLIDGVVAVNVYLCLACKTEALDGMALALRDRMPANG